MTGLALLVALLGASRPIGVAASEDKNILPPASLRPHPDAASKTITFPLLTHQHIVRRRLREDPSRSHDVSLYDRHPAPHHDRSLSEQQQQQQLTSLYQGYGTHYIDIWVGYPPQRQTAVVDTGSSVTAFPCSSCADCGRHADDPFREDESESFHTTPCAGGEGGRPCVYGTCEGDGGGECWVRREYGTGEEESGWVAYEAEDVAYAGGMHDGAVRHVDDGGGVDGTDPADASEFSFALTFGCQTEVSGYFEKQLASGVVGLDRRAQSFWGQMRSQQVIHRAQFSLCFVRQPLASKAGTAAGAVTLGGVDHRLNLTPMVFAKTVTEGAAASFKVRVRKIYLRESGGTSVMYDGKAKYHALDLDEETLNGERQFDIDSGTTDTYFTSSVSDEFRRVWSEITKQDFTNYPMKLSDDQIRKLPTVMLQFIPHEGGVGDEVSFDNPAEINGLAGKIDYATPNDVLFAIPAIHYMQKNAADGTYTARIYLDRDDATGSILGANAMMGHNILFDIDSGRIGVAESECNYAALVAEATGSPVRSEVGTEAAASNESTARHEVCGSLKCKGFMGLVCTVFFVVFFIFSRRYVTKRDDIPDTELEMKSSRSSNGRGGGYSDDEGDFSGDQRSGYRDKVPPPSYSDNRQSGSNERGSRHLSSNNSHHSSSSRRGPNDDGHSRNSNSHRISGDRSHQSAVGSIQSQHSSRSQRSHQSTQSNRTSSSHRSSGERSSATRGSHGSGGSRGSHRSQRSSTSHKSSRSDRDRYYEGERGSRRDRYDDYDDEISRPPSIS